MAITFLSRLCGGEPVNLVEKNTQNHHDGANLTLCTIVILMFFNCMNLLQIFKDQKKMGCYNTHQCGTVLLELNP